MHSLHYVASWSIVWKEIICEQPTSGIRYQLRLGPRLETKETKTCTPQRRMSGHGSPLGVHDSAHGQTWERRSRWGPRV
jgi:hypothetical protein